MSTPSPGLSRHLYGEHPEVSLRSGHPFAGQEYVTELVTFVAIFGRLTESPLHILLRRATW